MIIHYIAFNCKQTPCTLTSVIKGATWQSVKKFKREIYEKNKENQIARQQSSTIRNYGLLTCTEIMRQ